MASSPKVLVTGGAGFIGSHVVDELRRRGIPTVVFDSFVTGTRDNLAADQEIIEGDIRDRVAFDRAVAGVTHVVYLAAIVSVPESMKDPASTFDVNVSGAQNVFDACRVHGIERVVYASSAAVYGDEPTLPKQEDMPLAPHSPYALSKAMDEQYAALYAEVYGLPSVGLRFFNVYGPRQSGSHPQASVIPRWVEALRLGAPVNVSGDGSQTRDFIHVRDVARAVADALLSPLPTRRIFNVASGVETSLTDVLRAIEAAAGKEAAVHQLPTRPGDIRRSVADIGAIKAALGFAPAVSFIDGIRELLS